MISSIMELDAKPNDIYHWHTIKKKTICNFNWLSPSIKEIERIEKEEKNRRASKTS